ncbi:hypothetical protein [Rubritalea tangerina]|uniref:hypothetical protein n=1 Tax=Rubritalea tangerina TaxID=430798 RepID=UPI00361BD740
MNGLYPISRLGIDEWSEVRFVKFALRDFRVDRVFLQNVLVVILQAHSDHSVSLSGMREIEAQQPRCASLRKTNSDTSIRG